MAEVGLREGLVGHHTWIDLSLSDLKRFVGPLLELSRIELRVVNWVLARPQFFSRGVPVPVGVVERQIGVPAVQVLQRVPHGVQIGSTADVRQVDQVATGVTVGVVIVDQRRRVQRLVDVAHIVDQKAKRKRSGIILVGEGRGNLLVVVPTLIVTSSG